MKNIRWYLFWIKDWIYGSEVRKAYKDIKENYYNYNEMENEKKIQELLEYVTNNSEFYKQYKKMDISKFPIVNKAQIIENLNKMKTNKYDEKTLHTMSTSGSTGTPLTVKQNKEKRNRVIAEVIFFGEIVNYTFGQKQMNLRVWTDKNKKNMFQRKIQNMITQDISDLDEKSLCEIAELLKKDKKIKNILSYASTLDVISKYMLDNKYDMYKFNINSIISGAEALQEHTRENLKKIFKCYVVSRYSNQENGILAQEDINNKNFYLNQANYYFELLKLDEDVPAKKGELARVIITDLYNYAQPMIRYDTGDVVLIDEEKGKTVFKAVYGRRVDIIYNTKDEIISPHSITSNMWGIEGVKQFKFIQEDKGKYCLELNINKMFNNEEFILEKLKNILGKDSDIKIQYVNNIPVLESGKVKYVENRYSKR